MFYLLHCYSVNCNHKFCIVGLLDRLNLSMLVMILLEIFLYPKKFLPGSQLVGIVE